MWTHLLSSTTLHENSHGTISLLVRLPLLLSTVLAGCRPSGEVHMLQPERQPGLQAEGSRGMVVSDARLATLTGLQTLQAGGNAVDAAVAAAFALAVVYPEAGNIGGGGFIVAHFASGASATLDFREIAPLAATSTMYLGSDGQPDNRSLVGHLASGVPGSVAGLWEAHRRYGTLPWRELLEPAIRLAREGFTVDDRFARTSRDDSSRLARFPSSALLLLPGGKALSPGSIWKNPDLAATLERVADRGPSGFYQGETADLIVAEMRRGGGIITHADLERYRAVWRLPVEFTYRHHKVISMPPPSSGGVTLAIICNILEGYDLHALGWHSTPEVHLVAEAMRRAFADRNAYLGDPDVVRIPLDTLLSRNHASELRSTITPMAATPSTAIHAGQGDSPNPGMHTTHLSVVDGQGNALALTTTLNSLYGSAVAVSGAGFLMNNEMDDFAAKPGTPNMFGLVQGEANAIAPGKRILSSMTPTIVLDAGGKALLVTGARGGPYIISSVFHVLSNVIDFSMDLPAAVAAPRIHHQHLPDQLLYEEEGLGPEILEGLKELGHALKAGRNLGAAPSIMRRNGVWLGVADGRSGGYAEGF